MTESLSTTSSSDKQWFDYPVSHFLHGYLRAKAGLNVGMDNGLGGINKYVHGIHPGRYYLIGADSGVGKTTFADFAFVLNAVETAKKTGRKLHIFYYSFEISKVEKMAKWVAAYVFRKNNIRLSSEYIMGRIASMQVSVEHDKMIMEAWNYVEEEIMPYIIFIEDPVHPTYIFQTLIDNHFDKIGYVTRDAVTEQQKQDGKKGRIIGYRKRPGHEEDMTLILVDHVALTASEKGLNTKETIDRLSSYMVQMRNLFGAVVVMIQQFNSDLQTFNRNMQLKSKGASIILPQKLDFGDSKYTYRDADVVIGLVSPYQFSLEDFFGVDISFFKNYYIAAVLMKNRYGPANKMISYLMDPYAGSFEYIAEATKDRNPFIEQFYSPTLKALDECQKLFSQETL